MGEKLSVAIAAGGTAGHINPALALAEELVARGHSVRFFGQPGRLEGKLVPESGFDLFPVNVTGFDRSRPWTGITALLAARRAQSAVGREFAKTGAPDVAVGFGAYIEVPLMRWCAANKVPYVLHEQNSVTGLANKMMAPGASCVCISVPQAREAFAGRVGAQTPIVMTGNPVRRSVVESERSRGREAFGISDDATVLLVFGGSLGARHVNQAVCALKGELLSREGLRVIHSTGRELFEEVTQALALTEEEARRWQVMPYVNNMGDALAACDLVVSRAGASSIAEIAALAVPSVLVPYPLATGDHQTTNATALVDAGAAVLVPDSEVETAAFSDAVLGILDDPDLRARMRANAAGLGQDRAAATLADQVESVAKGA